MFPGECQWAETFLAHLMVTGGEQNGVPRVKLGFPGSPFLAAL